jgi:hypothetical protein
MKSGFSVSYNINRITYTYRNTYTIYFWKKESDYGFLGKTIPEFGRIWLWSLIAGIMIMGTFLGILIN